MPKGQKEPTDKKSVYVKFEQPDDLLLYQELTEEAESERRDIGTLILLKLLAERNNTK